MTRLVSSLILLTVAAVTFAQQPDNTPQSTAPTLRTGTKLVVVDVVVTDKKGMAVHDLKESDFTLLENNTPQAFKSFDEHTAENDVVRLAPTRPMPPGVFTNYTPYASNGPLNILLIDRLNTELVDQKQLTLQVNKYIKNLKPGTRMAIFGLNTNLVFLQGFTDNPEILQAAIDKDGNIRTSPLLNDAVGGNGVQTRPSDVVEEASIDIPVNALEQAALAASTVATMEQFERNTDSVQSQLRAKYTLDAMNALSHYLVRFPGRKNLIWFSGSFPINILPYQGFDKMLTPSGTDFQAVASMEKEFRDTTALLSRSQVAVYPIDAHGLAVPLTTTAANDDSTGRNIRNTAFIADTRDQSQANFDAHATMFQMASDTGGHAYVNTNDLATSLASAISNGSSYYTIAYTPTDANWNGNFRNIVVKLQQQGYILSYRRGYFADDPDALPKKEAAAASTAPTVSNNVRLALLRGGPSSGQIIFTARVLPASTAPEEAIAPNNNPSKTLKGPYRRYTIDFAADPRAMAFTDTPEGTHHDNIAFVSYLYDSDNKVVNTTSATISANLKYTPAEIAAHGGIPFHQQISVPDKGQYYLRVAVHDTQGDRVGALELPIAAVSHLPPAPPPPAPAQK